MGDLFLRSAVIEDIPQLMQIADECNLEHWSPQAYLREIDSTRSCVRMIVSPDGTAAGFLTGRVVPGSAEGSLDAELFNIGVIPPFRRQGIAGHLLRDFLDFCLDRNVHQIWLEVRESNASAIALYEKNHFEKVGSRKSFYAYPVESAVLMRLDLKE